MRTYNLKAILKAALRMACLLPFAAVAALGQQQVNLTAGPSSVTLPDGTTVPMWGYSCGVPVSGSLATCSALNPAATGWSPVVITIPTGATSGLTINLTNNLAFIPTGSTTPNNIPTSLVIVGQLGGGLGTTATSTLSPVHPPQGPTWPIAGDNSGPTFKPPMQGNRVQSFSSEVRTGTTALLPAWANLRPGTYLIESGTHPSIQGAMGLYGILVVTNAPTLDSTTGAETAPGTAYPGVTYTADVPLLLSEIDPVQNNAVNKAVNTVGFVETATHNLKLADSVNSIAVTDGGAGYFTIAPTVLIAGGGTPTTVATATASMDTDNTSPTYGQVISITVTNPGAGYTSNPIVTLTGGSPTKNATAASGLLLANSDPCVGGVPACYPPAVNYTPLYYLFNGVAFNKTNASASLFSTVPGSSTTPVTGNVLVRFVNAGLRMHVPSIVGSQTGTGAVSGFSLIAEDGNLLPGVPRVQSEVFLAAGKTYDVMLNVPAASATALPVYDRELSLSGNATARDAGMLAYIGVNGSGLPVAPGTGVFAAAVANADGYLVVPGSTLTVSDPAKGVASNDVNVYGVKVAPPTSCINGAPCTLAHGTLTLNGNGTFTYAPDSTWGTSASPGTTATDSFVYQANGSGPTAIVTLNACTSGNSCLEANTGIQVSDITYTSNVATSLSIKSPGILSVDKDSAGHPLIVAMSTVTPVAGLTLSVDKNGAFNASVPTPGTYTFTYRAQNSQGTLSASGGSGGAGNVGIATVTLVFPQPSGVVVKVLDGTDKTTPITDYRWIIEEDRTFYIDPTKTTNNGGTAIVPTFGTNFHTSYMPVVATGCVGPAGNAVACEYGQTVYDPNTQSHVNTVCDGGNGVCRTNESQQLQAIVDPSQVHLDPTKRYYISVLPGDAANAFNNANGTACATATDPTCGHGMGGAPIAAGQLSVNVLVQRNPFPPAKLSVFVFEDDFPLNGEQDAGGAVDVLASNEPGLGSFQITLYDDAGGSGDATGTPTYDMFNMPLSNSLAGQIDPATGKDACPISTHAREGFDAATGVPNSPTGMTGMIVTCPKYEADGITLSPLAGQAVIANLYPGRYGVVATPAADRIARGEEWLQTNTLDGQKAHDSFLRIGEPSYFQEFGPAGYHVSIGFANPKIINSRLAGVCNRTDLNITGSNCTNTVKGVVTTERMSRTPDERLFSSGDNSSFAFTQCYVSFGDPDGEDFAFTKCNSDGTFSMTGLPDGSWRITVFDQWNDMLVDGLSTPVLLGGGATTDMGQIAMNQWQANIYTSTFFDKNGNGVRDADEPGLSLVATNIRFRDGSFSNFNNTDLNGNAGFNEIFPLFSWYVVETDSTRYKNTGTHVVYDAGGPSDGSTCDSTAPCGTSAIGNFMANTAEQIPVPANLRVPGAFYCGNADCTDAGTSGFSGPGGTGGSTGRIDPAWVESEGWQGFSGQNSFLEFGKIPFAPGENGGIHGHVVYASTRPFDDPQLLLQLSWEPQVPNVTINLYQEGTATDGTQSLTLVDTSLTSSFDKWAQGFRSDGIPNMNCPGQGRDTGTDADLFFFTLYNQPMWLDVYNNGGTPANTLPNNSQFKCYDGMHNWNQVQPAPYDGAYRFPSIAGRNPQTGAPTGGTGKVPGTNCTICVLDPTDNITPMLPAGKYVVEVVVPPGYELVKEEDKNILIGDNYIAPVTQQFAGLGNIFIIPDQAAIGAAYNPLNPQNPTQDLGSVTFPRHEGDTGSVESFWPCAGASRIVPDYISLFPQSFEVSPFAGATRNLCDRKEVTLQDQASALAKFYIFTSTHAAAHFTGVITDDFTSEFDPFSPQFGEKFSPANLPISIKDWTGSEISRVYSDQWGSYNGLTYSTWEVNPPNPTGYAPQMMVTCMNDPGTGIKPDPLFNPQYSQFCYEIPFMPGQTQYMDTPVVPTSAFAGAGYNNPECAYPNATPAISEVDGDGIGPWVSTAGNTLTIHALGDQTATNYGYSGPSATTTPFNQKTVTRHYGFGNTRGSGGVTIGGVNVGGGNISTWNDSTIVLTVPANVPVCPLQQQAQYGGPTTLDTRARCGELVVTAGNGKQSIDAVTVTVGGKAPTHVPGNQPTIQAAIDTAQPGDLIIVDPGNYNEILLMWKPVRLQGVGAASSVINANTHPAGKLDPWRAQVNCLFGLALNGQPYNPATNPNPLLNGGNPNPYDSTGASSCPGNGWIGFSGGPNNPQVDRLPLEGIVGWDTTVNGNLAELLQEPSLMGAYEGAGITVLAKGVRFPAGVEVFGNGSDSGTVATESQMPLGTVVLTSTDCATSSTDPTNPFPSNFQCNPSSIDGLSITDSSQGGGGIFVHAWAHNLEIANNRIYNNAGTMSGGISVGQGESPDALLAGNSGDPVGFDQQPWTCVRGAVVNGVQIANPPGFLTDEQLPYCYDLNVNVHHNAITSNSSIGDELFSSTPAGAGGVTFCTGADNYAFNHNWLCGNLSTGDGGGLAQLGFSRNGDIEHNSILFNQSTNPTIPTNGGGVIVMGTAPDGSTAAAIECGSVTDNDCAPGLSDGVGPGLRINANLIMGNAAESGSGGGIRFQDVNGTEIVRFPSTPSQWYGVSVTNNIIANNVAGWDGAGISLQDALKVDLINNTIMSNDTTASSGVLFNTLGAPIASAPGSNCIQLGTTTASCPQPAGLVTMQHTAPLVAALPAPASVTCPAGYFTDNAPGGVGGNCTSYSVPRLYNDLFWQNRSFYIGVGGLGAGTLNQQNVVALYNAFTTTPAVSQPQAEATTGTGGGFIVTGGTGACVSPASYWDIGVRGDTGPGNHTSGLTLAPTYSLLTNPSEAGVGTFDLTNANPIVVGQYCNGSRVPPELGSAGYQVPPGISDATVPNPIFNLTPAATVDEGNNWININWGPLSLTNPVNGSLLGNYALAAGSPAINDIPVLSVGGLVAPSTDFFGNARPFGGAFDIGAVEFRGAAAARLTSITPNSGLRGTTVAVTLIGSGLTGATSVNVSGNGFTTPIPFTVVSDSEITASFTISGTANLTTRNVTVTVGGGNSNAVTFTVLAPPAPTLTNIVPNTGARGTSFGVTLNGTNLTGAAGLTGVGGGIAVTGFAVNSTGTQITATFTVSTTAGLTARTITVTTPGGTSNAVTFTVVGPTLTSITPASGVRGTSFTVTFSGTNLTGTTAVNAGAGIGVSAVTVVDNSTVTATFAIAGGTTTALGNRNVSVITNGVTTNNVTFTVQGATLASISPATGLHNTSVPVTLTGTSLAGATGVTIAGGGVTCTVTGSTSTTVSANCAITNGAARTARNVTVATPIGNSNTLTGAFTVN
jgi:hypothetical protein